MDILNNLFLQTTILTGIAVMVVQQVLKLRAIPVSFANRYPVFTVIVLSILGTILAFVVTPLAMPVTIGGWIVSVVLVLLVAAGTYTVTLKNWADLRAMEG